MWNACWQGALAIAVVWLMCRAFRLAPKVRLALWSLACLKLVLSLIALEPLRLGLLAADSELGGALSPFAPERHQGTVQEALAQAPSVSLLDAALGLYLLGLTVVIVKAAIEAARARSLVLRAEAGVADPAGAVVRQVGAAMGLTSPPLVLRSSDVSSPLVIGHLRPKLLLPFEFEQDLSEDELRMAIAHELSHLRRRDLWHATLPALAKVLFYFFPPAWLAHKEWATSCEAACDEEALAVTGASPHAYGELLLKIVTRGHHCGPLASFGATSAFHSLKQRIEWMGQPAFKFAPKPLAIGALSFAALLTIPWSLSASPPPPSKYLANSGMESGQYLPSGWSRGADIPNVRYIWDKSTARSGKRSLCIAKSERRYWPISEWSQPVAYDGKQRFIELSAWIKADQAYKAVLDVQLMGNEPTHQWAAFIGAKEPGDPPAHHNWKRYSGVVPIPQGTKEIVVALQGYGPGTVWMDDVSVRYLTSPK
jgi:beta-lactamase regulating signal transducer with metallopeptidase domain